MVNIPFLGFQHVSTIPNLWFIGFRNGPSTESHHPALPVLVRNVRDAFREFDTSGDGFIGKVVILGIYIYIYLVGALEMIYGIGFHHFLVVALW